MHIPLPENKSLLPHQIDGVTRMLYFLSKNSACYNADDMGLGKTIQTIAAINYVAKAKNIMPRILIACPAIMRLVWEEELKSWATFAGDVCVVLKGADLEKTVSARIVIASYDILATDNALMELRFRAWDFLVLDEAHYTKSRKAKRTKAIYNTYWKASQYRILLSGTPFTKNVVDGFTAFNACMPQQFPNFFHFAGEYSYQKQTLYGVDYYGVRNSDKLNTILYSNFMVRRKKEEVLTSLPPKVVQKIMLPEEYSAMAKASKDEKADLQAQMQAALKNIAEGKDAPVSPSLASHRQEQGLKKLKPVLDFISNIAEGEPVVVFTWHKAVAAAIVQELEKYKPLAITGEVTPSARQEIINQFQAGKSNIFVGTIASCNTGITLTKASKMVFVEMAWTPAMNAQAQDRIYRIGQQNNVTIYNMVVKNSIDEAVYDTVMSRMRDFEKVLAA